MEAVGLQSAVRDICLIIIGDGEAARQIARRRVAAGGRLLLLWTNHLPARSFIASGFSWAPSVLIGGDLLYSWPHGGTKER